MSDNSIRRNYTLPTERARTMNRRKRKFLEALSQTGTVAKAAKAAGVDPSTVYGWRRSDEEFRKAWDGLADQVGTIVEDALIDRAVNGVERTIYFRGEPVGVERQYSDAGSMALLRGLKPERYRESGGALNLSIGNFGIAVLPATMLSEDEWEAQARALTDQQNKISARLIEGEAERVEDGAPVKRGS